MTSLRLALPLVERNSCEQGSECKDDPARAMAEKVETANARQRGALLEAGAVEAEWTGVLRGVRARLLAVPFRLPHLTPHDVSEMDAEIRAELEFDLRYFLYVLDEDVTSGTTIAAHPSETTGPACRSSMLLAAVFHCCHS